MPLLAINLSDTLSDQIKVLVEKGLYRSFEAFLEIAAFNQLALERGATPAEIVERGHRQPRRGGHAAAVNGSARAESKAQPADVAVKTARASPPRRAVEPVARMAPPDDTTVTEEVFNATFKRLALLPRTEASPLPCEPSPNGLSSERVFGQVNRLLPLKLACRWLASAAVAEGKWPRYDLISDRLADDAATVGSLLEEWDAKNERKRDELLATGLPRRGNSASRDRFLTMFMARVTRGGEIYPATICQYQLARFNDSAIVLTEQGMAFCDLESPILDKRDTKSTVTLATAESEFLVRQIHERVPAEREDMQAVLQIVKEGKTSPADLSDAVRSRFPDDWSDSVFQTHLSGLVARLGDLRLLRRNWQGRNVLYELAEEQLVESFFKV